MLENSFDAPAKKPTSASLYDDTCSGPPKELQKKDGAYTPGPVDTLNSYCTKSPPSPLADSKAANTTNLSDEQIESYACKISRIISKNRDFSYGKKNEDIRDIFNTAAGAGTASRDKLFDLVNHQLASSGLSLRYTYSIESTEQLRDLGEFAIATDPLIYLDASFDAKTVAHLSVRLSSISEEEDAMKIDRELSHLILHKKYQPPFRRGR